MMFSLHPISGTPNYLIRQKRRDQPGVTLVAEVVEYPEGYTLYRMDATGVLAAQLATPDEALSFYKDWVKDTNQTIVGIAEN
ncbi:MAG: hypothetical protein KF761_01670 [Salinibacterium sp.]|nr:hypothetical protein [Salinibacterium sp.]